MTGLDSQFWAVIEIALSNAQGAKFKIQNKQAISGGCINHAFKLSAEDGREAFIKTSSHQPSEMLASEVAGLEALAETHTLCVPKVWGNGQASGRSFLILDYLHLTGSGKPERFGTQLATLHKDTQDQFGWPTNNTLGLTPQINTPSTSWVEFLRQHRLGYQFELARENGYPLAKTEQLLTRLPQFFTDYQATPSLLHGDLWTGNYGYNSQGDAVIFDPAVYYGDREAELAMTELFGGFPAAFYSAYNETWPLDAGYKTRRNLYQLYHLVNHLNLFGESYLARCDDLIASLLAEC